MSQRSSNIVVAAALKLPNITAALMDKHLRPMARALGMPKYSAKDKNWLIVDLARLLILKKWVTVPGGKTELFREDVSVLKYQ